MQNLNLLPICLTLFDGGAAAGAAAGTGGAPAGAPSAGDGAAAPAGIKASPSSSRKGKAASDTAVVYGKQPGENNSSDAGSAQKATEQPASASAVTSDAMEAKRAAFEDLINGEYKDVFTDRTQKIINQRFKETKTLQTQLEQSTPIMEMLRQRYKLGDGASSEQLLKALENDDAYWEAGAEEAGMTVDQYKYVKKLERENESIRTMQQRQESQQKANETYSRWLQQSESMKGEYPDFDLQAECQANPQFISLLRANVDVKTAYEVTHIGDIKKTVAQSTAKNVESNVVANIRAKGARPNENGVQPSPGFVVKDDVKKLTPADRKRIAQRAYAGERIQF